MSIFNRVKPLFIFVICSAVATFLFQNCSNKFQSAQSLQNSSRDPASAQYGAVITTSPSEHSTGSKITPEELSLMSASVTQNSLTGSALTAAVANLPAKVDNSASRTFPPIIDQGNVGSCYAMATVYYTASNELCRSISDCDNRYPLSSRSVVLSPRWVHSLFFRNNAQEGSSAYSAAQALQYMGGVLQRDDPYDNAFLQDPESGLKVLPTMTQIKEGLRFRIRYAEQIEGITPYSLPDATDINSEGVNKIKVALASGRVATLQTWAYSFRMGDVAYPEGPSGVRERAVTHVCGGSGPHEVTVVGYDDNIWVDINRNGVEDSGERGAFKIANSWGTEWGNKGFIWAPYDAHRPRSRVTPLGMGTAAQDCSNESATENGGGIQMKKRIPFTMGWNLLEPLKQNGELFQPRLVTELDLKSDPQNLSGPFMLSGVAGTYGVAGIINFGWVPLNILSARGIPQTTTILFDLTPNLPASTEEKSYAVSLYVDRAQFPQTTRRAQSFRVYDYWMNNRLVFETSPTEALDSSAYKEEYLFSFLNTQTTAPTSCKHWQLLYNGACVDKTQACTVANGLGEKAFINGSYSGACITVGCSAGFVLAGNLCVKDPTVPDAPVIVSAEAVFGTTVLVNFKPPVSDGGRPITNYKVTVSPGVIAPVIVTSSPALITGLPTGTSYTFTVTAINSIGSSLPSANSNAVMLGGSAPIDTVAPVVNSLSMAVTSSSRSIFNIVISASDNVGVTGYLITETASAPSASVAGWSSVSPTSFTFSGSGSGTLTAYAWAKDAAGNVSASRSASVVVTIASTASACTDARGAAVGSQLTCTCSSAATLENRQIWGTNYYTDDSTICVAAVHAGVLNAGASGSVTITKFAGCAAYQGSTQHSITSTTYGNFGGSYHFNGHGSAECSTTTPNPPVIQPLVFTSAARTSIAVTTGSNGGSVTETYSVSGGVPPYTFTFSGFNTGSITLGSWVGGNGTATTFTTSNASATLKLSTAYNSTVNAALISVTDSQGTKVSTTLTYSVSAASQPTTPVCKSDSDSGKSATLYSYIESSNPFATEYYKIAATCKYYTGYSQIGFYPAIDASLQKCDRSTSVCQNVGTDTAVLNELIRLQIVVPP